MLTGRQLVIVLHVTGTPLYSGYSKFQNPSIQKGAPVRQIVLVLPTRVKVRLRRLRRSTRDARLAMHCQIILKADKGHSPAQIANALDCSRSCAWRVICRFQNEGEAGLLDRREDNGELKLDEAYLGQLVEVVGQRPSYYGHRRPTWTLEVLITVMTQLTGVRVHRGTMSRGLRQIGARRGRPRPTVHCPWSQQAKEQRLAAIRRCLGHLARDEVAVYEDEVDIHLNPKIGLDWMNRGQQKEVVTPGQNEKRYLAGAMNARTRRLTVVEATRKNSSLFIALLEALAADYPDARRIHVVLDNFRIHTSKISQCALDRYDGRIVLHFLPPYCPNHNKIERLWLDLHAEVTRNHNRDTMNELMAEVRRFLKRRSAGHDLKIRRIAA
jgi:transposase